MVVYSIILVPHEKDGWYRMTLTSEKAAWGMGQTTIELIVNDSTLRILRNQIIEIVGEKPTHDLFGEK